MRLARSPLTAVSALLACLALAGCASSSTAGWTFAPPPSATPIPAASAGASGAPGASPAASAASPAASGATADVTISALNIAFEQASVDAPAGKAFSLLFDNKDASVPHDSLLFDNKDASVPHDVWIKDASGTVVFQGAIITGPGQTTYNVPALAAGTYTFTCSVHANMTGTLVAK
jgi:plastocyanin